MLTKFKQKLTWNLKVLSLIIWYYMFKNMYRCIYLSIEHRSIYWSVELSLYRSIYLFVCLFVFFDLFVYLSVYPSILIYLFASNPITIHIESQHRAPKLGMSFLTKGRMHFPHFFQGTLVQELTISCLFNEKSRSLSQLPVFFHRPTRWAWPVARLREDVPTSQAILLALVSVLRQWW